MYYVVGCPECRAIWILEGEQESTTCRSCRKQHQLKKLKRFIETEHKNVAVEARAEILAEQAGQKDEYREARQNTDGFTSPTRN